MNSGDCSWNCTNPKGKEGHMKTDTNTHTELLAVDELARRVYESRTNFTKLCEALEALYAHYDAEEISQAA
jgi:hypothetical protein